MVSSDFHCKENDVTTGAANLVQTFFFAISPDVRSLVNHRSLVLRYLILSGIRSIITNMTHNLTRKDSTATLAQCMTFHEEGWGNCLFNALKGLELEGGVTYCP